MRGIDGKGQDNWSDESVAVRGYDYTRLGNQVPQLVMDSGFRCSSLYHNCGYAVAGCRNAECHELSVVISGPADDPSVQPSGEQPTHQIGRFAWSESGHGFTNHVFDESARAVSAPCAAHCYEPLGLKATSCLECSRDGRCHDPDSNYGMSPSRVVAYKEHVEVRSFRYYGGDERPFAKPLEEGVIWVEWNNYPERQIARIAGGVCLVNLGNNLVISDELQPLIDLCLSGSRKDPGSSESAASRWSIQDFADRGWPVTICKHNPLSGGFIRLKPENAAYLPRLLCYSCRMKGLRWDEVLQRNPADLCPYVKRALKAFGEKSDQLPEWVNWSSPIIASHRWLKEGAQEVWGILFLRQRDGFIRRAVLLLDTDKKEAWTFSKYYEKVPHSLAEFTELYGEGRLMDRPNVPYQPDPPAGIYPVGDSSMVEVFDQDED